MAVGPAPEHEIWSVGLRWARGIHMQADRFESALFEFEAALVEAGTRADLNGREDSKAQGWRDSYDRKPDIGERPVRVPSRELAIQVANELDFLLVAARNLLSAQDRLPPESRTEMADQDVVKVLRDVSEHFDEVGGRGRTSLAADWPDLAAGAVAFTNKEVWLGGLTGVPLSRIRAWAWRVEQALRSALAGVGVDMPENLGESIVEGDDDLPWPRERLRYGWWIPQVEEAEWPQEEMPTEIAELVLERFRSLRDRDHAD